MKTRFFLFFFVLLFLGVFVCDEKSQAAVSYVGASNLIATNGGAPGAITPNAGTQDGDLLVFYHYSRATGGNETVTQSSFSFTFNSVTASKGLVAVGWRIKQAGDATFTATITNHTSSTSGETVLEWIETYRGTDTTNPIVNYTAALSNWTTSLNLGPISAPATATVNDGDMAVVFGGRFENVTAQTVLTGHSLTWANRVLNNSSLGTDAGAVSQNGLNSSGSDQTITAKTITTTGTTQVGAGRMFIIEKAAAAAPIVSISQPASGNIAVAEGSLYNITYSLTDSDSVVTSAFYYDTNNTGLNGTAITGACATAPEGSGVTCIWNTTGVPLGTYYVYGITNDGVNLQVSAYSIGMITIQSSGSLAFDIVDGTGATVASPSVSFANKNFAWTVQQSIGTLGTSSQKIRVTNTTATPSWTLSVAATSGNTALWTSGGNTYDFNGISSAGRLQINPATGTITPQTGCSSNPPALQSSAYFAQGTLDSISLAVAGASAPVSCYWDFTGLTLTQDIPSVQKTGTYTLSLTLTAV